MKKEEIAVGRRCGVEQNKSTEMAGITPQDWDSKVVPKDPRPFWLSNFRQLSSSLTSKCRRYLDLLEQPEQRGLGPRESFELFSSLGNLEYSNWQESFIPVEETTQLATVARELCSRLSSLVKRRERTFQLGMEAGITEVLKEIEKEIRHPDRRYRHMAYDDLEAILMRRLDQLGYVLLMIEETGFQLPQTLAQKVDQDYASLRNVVPRLMEKFELRMTFQSS